MKTTLVLTIACLLITLLSACAEVGPEGGHEGGHQGGHQGGQGGCSHFSSIMNNEGNEKSSNPLPLIPGQPIKEE
jgi:hypothetical protein